MSLRFFIKRWCGRICTDNTEIRSCVTIISQIIIKCWSNFRMTLKWKRTNKTKKQTNGNKAIWSVYWTDANAPGFWLVKWILGWKNFMPEELSRNRFDVILQHDWSIEQCLLHVRVFFGGNMKSPCFVLFIHWLIKQIANTYGNHFSRSFENRSNMSTNVLLRSHLP